MNEQNIDKQYNDNPLKLIYKTAIPGLLISLMLGIYVFADQLMMVKFIPMDGVHTFSNIFTSSHADIERIVNTYSDHNIKMFEIPDIVRTMLTSTVSLVIIIEAIPSLIAVGGSIIFVKNLGKKHINKSIQVWNSTFFYNIITSIFFSILIISVSEPIISMLIGSINANDYNYMSSQDQAIYVRYLREVNDQARSWGTDLIRILSAGQIFACFSLYFSLFIRAEARTKFVTMSAIITNVINVALDFVLIRYAALAALGGAIATVIGWVLNTSLLSIFLVYLNRHENTLLSFRILNIRQIDFTIFPRVVILGLGTFLSQLSFAIIIGFYLSNFTVIGAHYDEASASIYFQTLYGGVSPIETLFWIAIYGIVDGLRPLITYHYARKNKVMVRKILIIGGGTAIIYAIFVLLLVYLGVGPYLLELFDIRNTPINPHQLDDARYYILVNFIEVAFYSVCSAGFLYFQGTAKMHLAAISSSISLFTFLPVIYTIFGISINGNYTNATDALWLYIWSTTINTGIGAVILSIWVSIYYHFYMFKPTKREKQALWYKID